MPATWVKKNAVCDKCLPSREIARFDARLKGASAWGNFCKMHWKIMCPRNLGTGVGQMLVRDGEDPALIAVELGVDDLVVIDRRFQEPA